MSDLSRRRFLQLAGLGAGTLFLPWDWEPQKWFFFGKTRRVTLWGDGVHDDTRALRQYFETGRVHLSNGRELVSMWKD